MKKRASAFHGTYLAELPARPPRRHRDPYRRDDGRLRPPHGEDAIAEGFRPIVVREAVGDRVPGVVEWNLFDIDAKFGDVEPLDVSSSTSRRQAWQEAQPATAAGMMAKRRRSRAGSGPLRAP